MLTFFFTISLPSSPFLLTKVDMWLTFPPSQVVNVCILLEIVPAYSRLKSNDVSRAKNEKQNYFYGLL